MRLGLYLGKSGEQIQNYASGLFWLRSLILNSEIPFPSLAIMGGGGRKSLAYLKNNKKLKPIFILVRCVQFLSIAKQFLSIANNVDESDQLGRMLNTCNRVRTP